MLLKQFISVANPGGAEPVPGQCLELRVNRITLLNSNALSDSALVYFAQNASYLGPIAGTSPDPVTKAVGFNENATLPFQPGKTYRLRIINTSAFAAFFFWIDGHEMRIIEADGVSIDIIKTGKRCKLTLFPPVDGCQRIANRLVECYCRSAILCSCHRS